MVAAGKMVGFAASRTSKSTYRCSGSVRAAHHLLLHTPYGELAVGKVTIKADPVEAVASAG